MCIRTTHVYKDNTCVCGQDMCIQTTHVYTDNTFRILCPMILYVSDEKNDVYGVFISTALQQKCLHTSGFINGSCVRTRHWHNLRPYIRPNTALNSEESSVY